MVNQGTRILFMLYVILQSLAAIHRLLAHEPAKAQQLIQLAFDYQTRAQGPAGALMSNLHEIQWFLH